MIKLKKPDLDQKLIIEDCISNMQVGSRLNNIILSKMPIVSRNKEYDLLASQGKLSTINTHSVVDGGATKDNMVWLYDNKFVKGRGRKYYTKLMAIPPYGTCPFCGQRKVSTLDHYLPKTQYPTYSISPYNLIASCSDCNKLKGDEIINSRKEETIHPYYDEFDNEVWVKARVIEEEPIGFEFFVDKPISWNETKFIRVKKHFKVFELGKLYASHAAEEYAEYNQAVLRMYKTGKADLVINDLKDKIDTSRSVRMNTWKAAMYSALLESKWYFEMLSRNVSI